MAARFWFNKESGVFNGVIFFVFVVRFSRFAQSVSTHRRR
jgi:hypothetical protein